jgi:hypothetical protein
MFNSHYPASDDAARERALHQEFHRLQAALREESARPGPDLSRVRMLRDRLIATRNRLARLQNEPPPHTD